MKSKKCLVQLQIHHDTSIHLNKQVLISETGTETPKKLQRIATKAGESLDRTSTSSTPRRPAVYGRGTQRKSNVGQPQRLQRLETLTATSCSLLSLSYDAMVLEHIYVIKWYSPSQDLNPQRVSVIGRLLLISDTLYLVLNYFEQKLREKNSNLQI